MEQLTQWDSTLFSLINGMHLPEWLEAMLIYWRNPLTWIPLYLFWVLSFGYRYGKRGLVIIMGALLAVALADVLSGQLLKNLFMRPRPCHLEIQNFLLRVPCGSGYSMPSAHATNHFALATYFGLYYLRRAKTHWPTIALLVWAAGVGFAQIFVGVHYPSDIVVGTAIGILIGYGMYHIVAQYLQKASHT